MRHRTWRGTLIALAIAVGVPALAAEPVYYARCNLKVVGGTEISWVNWQSTPDFIPAGTKLTVTRQGDKATLVNPATNKSYNLDIGADGEPFLEKFISREPVSIARFPAEVQAHIRDTVAKVGMTKQQVYIAMGPPTNVGKQRTNQMTYKEILGHDLWIYARRRMGKNIGVAFDAATGRVNRTEGIWGK